MMKIGELERAILAKKTYESKLMQYNNEIIELSWFETLDMLYLPRKQFNIVFLNGCNNVKDCIVLCKNKVDEFNLRIKRLETKIKKLTKKHYESIS